MALRIVLPMLAKRENSTIEQKLTLSTLVESEDDFGGDFVRDSFGQLRMSGEESLQHIADDCVEAILDGGVGSWLSSSGTSRDNFMRWFSIWNHVLHTKQKCF